MDEQKAAVPAAGPVTLDDVRAALGDIAPGETNANKLRAVIGRGSFATIQKHIETLRAQRIAAAQPVAEQSIPKPPQDAVEMLWAAAWGAAQTKTLARLEGLSAERDGLLMQSQSQAADIASLAEQLDTLESSFQSQAAALKVAQESAEAQVLSAKTALERLSAELVSAHAEITKARSDAKHAAELAARDAVIAQQAMQSAIDRLTDQLSESKALHIAHAMQPPVQAPAPADVSHTKEKK
jgi:hypothetical protein